MRTPATATKAPSTPSKGLVAFCIYELLNTPTCGRFLVPLGYNNAVFSYKGAAARRYLHFFLDVVVEQDVGLHAVRQSHHHRVQRPPLRNLLLGFFISAFLALQEDSFERRHYSRLGRQKDMLGLRDGEFWDQNGGKAAANHPVDTVLELQMHKHTIFHQKPLSCDVAQKRKCW